MAECWSTVRGCLMRVTKVDNCGLPTGTTDNVIVTKGFVTVDYAAEIEDAEEYLLKNACGEVCVYDTSCPELKYYNLEMEFCEVNPDLLNFMTNQPVVADFNGESVGIDVGTRVSCDTGFALEVWTEIPNIACEQAGKCYGYFLVPWITNGILGDFTIENDVITFSVSARSRNQHQWRQGPYNDVDVTAVAAGAETLGALVTPVPRDTHLRMQKICGDVPVPSCDPQSVDMTNFVPAA